MPRPADTRRLSLEDVHLCKSPAAILQLLARLGYAVEPEAVPLRQEDVGFAPADAAAILNLYLLAGQGADSYDGPSLQVVLFELQELALARLRSLATNLLSRGGNYLILATSDYRRLTFVNPRREGGRVKIAKLVVDTAHPTRHDLDVLEGLAVNGQDPEALYQAHCAAFDVEKVTARFYRQYAALFQRVQQVIQQHNKGLREFYDPQRLDAFAQRLLGRIMFLYFVQKKGWLAGDPRFLTHRYRAATREGANYYASVLEPLFLDTLNRRRPDDDSPWGSIPYLDGGLFERDYDFQVHLPNELFDPASDQGLLGFFDSYNFTVAEDTPTEQEVAVDPEMLGKVFENMMEEQDRGRSGTYYTPRPIVHYMCREALLGYLEERTGLDPDLLATQFDEDTDRPLTLHQANTIERAVDEVRVLDPAVGTGAFLVGILHELVNLKRACYRARNVQVPRSSALVAEWKRGFIRECLYGVDIKPEAIEIAKLRLWLSLVVDLDRSQVEPLPNLDYKLMVGDSLIETVDGQPVLPAEVTDGAQGSLGLGATEQAIAALGRLKERFFTAGPEERPELRAQIQAQEKEIVLANLRERLADLKTKSKALAKRGALVNWRGMQKEKKELERLATDAGRLSDLEVRIRAGEAPLFFLYRLHFFQVFQEKGGFDVVIANPPYVRMELIKEQKATLKAVYPQVYDGRADLYVYFYGRGLDLLRPGGMLAFISSNKFMRARYGAGLRDLLSKGTALRRVIDFGDLPVFEATAYPCILITRRAAPRKDSAPQVLPVGDVETIGRLVEEVPRQAWPVPQVRLSRAGWTLQRPEVLRLLDKLRAAGRPLGQVVDGRCYRGIVTGLNDAFVVDEATRAKLIADDPRSAEIIKPWLRGRDVKRWRVDRAGLYVIFTYHGIDMNRYPAAMTHLQAFRERLQHRATVGHHTWYELQQPQTGIYAQFDTPKIVWPDIAPHASFAFDDGGAFPDCTLFTVPLADYYLLGLLNSVVGQFFCRHISSTIQQSFMRFKTQYVQQIPVPLAAAPERQGIDNMVRQLLQLRGEGPAAAALEQQLDEQVCRLFRLRPDEVLLARSVFACTGYRSQSEEN